MLWPSINASFLRAFTRPNIHHGRCLHSLNSTSSSLSRISSPRFTPFKSGLKTRTRVESSFFNQNRGVRSYPRSQYRQSNSFFAPLRDLINRLPPNAIIYSIIAINGVVFMLWQGAKGEAVSLPLLPRLRKELNTLSKMATSESCSG